MISVWAVSLELQSNVGIFTSGGGALEAFRPQEEEEEEEDSVMTVRGSRVS